MFERILEREKNVVILFFLLGLFIRLMVLALTDNIAEDTGIRILEAERWLQNPEPITSGVWFPLNYYLTAIALFLWNDPNISPRLVSLIFGSLSLIPFYYLVRMLFDKNCAAISTLLLSTMGLHIIYSVLSMSEVPFIFFLITSFYFFFKFLKSENANVYDLFVSILFFTMSNMLRIESWLFIPILSFLLFKKGEYKWGGFFLVLSSVFPVFWMAGCYIELGNPLPLAAVNISQVNLQEWGILKKLYIYPYIISKYVTPLVFLISVGGMCYSIFRMKHIHLAVLFITQITFLTFITYWGTNAAPRGRYSLLMCVLILPYFYVGIKKVLNGFKIKVALISIIILSIISTNVYLYFYRAEKTVPLLPKGAKEFALHLKNSVGIDEKLLFLKCVGGGSNLAVLAGLKPEQVGFALFNNRPPKVFTFHRLYDFNEEGLGEYFTSMRPNYVALSYGSFLTMLRSFKKRSHLIRKNVKSFKLIHHKDIYYLYRVYYKEEVV